ncbi:MAG: bifunctional riboflavin kinase/FAD synthetase [Planctomycetota bacterium]|jgi:riboflavin kinase/FMN adenylyltransferase
MKVLETKSDLGQAQKGCVVTIGNFDGVHTGHQKILTTARNIADEKQTELTVITFEPHPVAILYPEKSPGVLMPLELKKHLLAEVGVDCLCVLKSDPELLKLSPGDFVNEFLVKSIQPVAVVEGENFNFGYGRSGSIHTLYNLGKENGFEVIVVEAMTARLSIGHAVKVSSTLIRNMLEAGKVNDASVALGRPYRLVGEITAGRGKGKELGFPTANIEPATQITPTQGVYAGFVEIADSFDKVCISKEKTPAVFSIGRTSTYGTDKPLLIEAHLLIDDVGDLIGKWMAMDFVQRLRDQIKFESETKLSEQIAKDCEKAKEILENMTN